MYNNIELLIRNIDLSDYLVIHWSIGDFHLTFSFYNQRRIGSSNINTREKCSSQQNKPPFIDFFTS